MAFDKISDALKKAAEEKEKDFTRETESAPVGRAIERKPTPIISTPKIAERATDEGVDPRIVAYNNPEAGITEQYRTLWTHILSLDKAINLETIAITSSHALEGKTVTALNLAIIMARDSEKKILLVDCNLRNPDVHRYLGLVSHKGLNDILREETPLETVLLKTNIKNLSILPAGGISSNPTELLMSEGIKHLLAELKRRFDYVILDTPPIIPYADARILGPLVDGVILVIQSGRTRREVVWRAESILTGMGTKILGYVLTGVEYHIPEYIHRHL